MFKSPLRDAPRDQRLDDRLAVKLTNPATGNDVHFDDCRRSDGTMIEAKGTGYLAMLRKGDGYPWKGVQGQILEQADRQVKAARGRPIEWHFAEKEVADSVRKLFAENKLNIIVIYTPPPW